MSGLNFDRRDFLGGLASSALTADALDLNALFRRRGGVDQPAAAAAAGGEPDAVPRLKPASFPTRNLTPEVLLLRGLPTTCPPLMDMIQGIYRLDLLRTLDPRARATLCRPDSPFWPNYERVIGSIRETVDASPPLLRLFVPDELSRETNHALDAVRDALDALDGAAKARDVQAVVAKVAALALRVEALGRLTVAKFPYDVPRGGRFETLPRLLGRADATLTFRRLSSLDAASTGSEGAAEPVVVRVVLDGYSAPISAGDFADLAERGFYNGLPLYDGLGLQRNASALGQNALGCGAVSANVSGFVNPATGDYRTVPLEYKGVRAAEPVYVEEDEAQLDDDDDDADAVSVKRAWGKARSQPPPPADAPVAVQSLPPVRMASGPPALPLEVEGVLGLLHPPGDPDGASSQFFWLASPQSDGRRLNGRYAPFAVVVGGYEALLSLRAGDRLESVQLERRDLRLLKRPEPNPQYSTRTRSAAVRDYNMLSGEYIETPDALPADVPPERVGD